MRNSEWFVKWMKGLGLYSNYNESQYNLYLADSAMSFREDGLLFENADQEKTDYTVFASYFPAKKRSQIGLGSAYSSTIEPSYIFMNTRIIFFHSM